MLKADLQIHSKYSSHALYMPYKKIMDELLKEYPSSTFFEGKVWWMEHLAIDGVSGPEHILQVAKLRGLDAISITDHNTLIGNIEAQRLSNGHNVKIISGMEISTSEGELLAYGIKEKIPFRIDPFEAVRRVHEQGGIVAIPHPFLKPHPKKDFATLQENLILELKPDAIDVFSPIFGMQKYWSEFARQNGIAELGTSDAHMDALIGTVWTEFPDECKTQEDFIEAIKYKKSKASGIKERGIILIKAALEYTWKNTIGRQFIKF